MFHLNISYRIYKIPLNSIFINNYGLTVYIFSGKFMPMTLRRCPKKERLIFAFMWQEKHINYTTLLFTTDIRWVSETLSSCHGITKSFCGKFDDNKLWPGIKLWPWLWSGIELWPWHALTCSEIKLWPWPFRIPNMSCLSCTFKKLWPNITAAERCTLRQTRNNISYPWIFDFGVIKSKHFKLQYWV